VASAYLEKRNQLTDKPNVRISDLLAAREHLAILEKTSNANVRKNTKSSVNKVMIGKVCTVSLNMFYLCWECSFKSF
jgi:hypothetical protein